MPRQTKTTTATQKVSEPATQATKRTPPTKRPELTEFQEKACELAGDLILNGGDGAVLHAFLVTILEHDYRRCWEGRLNYSPEEMNHKADEWAIKLVDRWEQAIRREWPIEKPATTEPEPRTVTECARASVRHELRDEFEDFVRDATPEEIRLMNDVMLWWQSINKDDGPEMEIANAFMGVVGKEDRYLRVPERFLGLTVQYLEMLESGRIKANA